MYAELHCKTNFSFLEGASHAEELVARAIELQYRAIAVTDRNSLAGVVRAYSASREHELKLLIGAELAGILGSTFSIRNGPHEDNRTGTHGDGFPALEHVLRLHFAEFHLGKR